MRLIQDSKNMQSLALAWREKGKRIGFVPTLGGLHEGHLSLLKIARSWSDIVVLSIFLNPSQFAVDEDLDAYPRTFEADRALCEAAGVDLIFCPSRIEMYPHDYSTWVLEESLGLSLCGRSRPHHFRGVTTIVCKLFLIILPHLAVFGQKDPQQALIIKRMVRDLHFPIEILIGPIIREDDGLAMSTRNRYLDLQKRQNATALYHGLLLAKEAWKNGECRSVHLKQIVYKTVEASGAKIDYIDCVDPNTLKSLDKIDKKNALLMVSAFYGKVRLIDNIVLV